MCFSTSSGAICHLIERKSRHALALKLPDKSAKATRLALARGLRRLPREMVRSLTFDNGLEFSQYYILRESLGISTYAPQAHKLLPSLFILGEGRGGASELPLRHYLLQNTDLSQLPQSELNDIRNELNCRPMAALGFNTPKEVLRYEWTRSVALHL